MPPVHLETELAIPLEHAGEALAALRACIERERHVVNFVQELRFGPAESAWLAGAHGRATCHFGAYLAPAWAGRRAAVNRYFTDFHALLAAWDPRPHWGKEQPREPGAGDRYPRAAAFRALRAELDPEGRFAGRFLAHAFP